MIENTDIADMFFDESLMDKSRLDENGLGIGCIIGLDEAVIAKYGDYMTEDALERAGANRTLLIGEVTAKEYGSRLEPGYVNLWEEKNFDSEDITYQFSLAALVKFNDGSDELVNLYGSLVMKKVDAKWKVNDFQINRTELANILQFGQS